MTDNKVDMDYRLLDFYDEVDEDESALLEDSAPIYYELMGLPKRYTDFSFLAKGGMKQVSKVFDQKSNRHVAYAQLLPESPRELYEPFLREGRLTALLEHPNIITIHDVGVDRNELPYFTMEIMTGQTLAEIIKQLNAKDPTCQYSQDDLLRIFIKICDAISYAHSKGVLHLDIKPENIQVGQFGEVIICDWGLGKIIGSEEEEEKDFDELLLNPDLLNNMTLDGVIKGTPGFMAPEQIHKMCDMSEQTDIYSLGSILYTILCLKSPIEAENTKEALAKTTQGEFLLPSERLPDSPVPKSLEAVISKAMERNPEDRYESCVQLKSELEKYLSGHATHAENAGIIKLLSLLYKRNKTLSITIISAITLFTIGVIISFKSLKQREQVAQNAKLLAEENLQKYKISQEEKEKVRARLQSNLLENFKEFRSTANLRVSAKKMQQAILNDPENKKLWLELGNTYFMMQDFEKSIEAFEKSGAKKDFLLMRIAKKYKDRKGNRRLLSGDDLGALFRDINNPIRWPVKRTMLLFDSITRANHDDHTVVVKSLLEEFNPEWNGAFKYSVRHSLLITGPHLKTLAKFDHQNTPYCLLSTLKINSLHLYKTSFSDLHQIRGLNINKLDIRGTKVSDLSPLQFQTKIRILIILPGQFTKEQLKQLPSWIAYRQETYEKSPIKGLNK
ncbi:probable serine/threonine-protein kinase pknB [Lentisphaera araneosa HTCC2155]|uniref:Probable serine/threonine-protein kinase pknB n=1 Tax=Lentisphaera araneosa HTCC2155 TaxID=313628 RepID=A6DJ54_9BACT|nr:protein kinase [Lentisphaera araneosa]EDM28490.1 probable serine/threonine-protein kinase pknB [Lentisphaera araneosa HTCC2155]